MEKFLLSFLMSLLLLLPARAEYALVTSVDELVETDEFVIVCPSKNKVMGQMESNAKFAPSIDLSPEISDGKFTTLPSNAQVFTIEKSGEKYLFKGGTSYLSCTADKSLNLSSNGTAFSVTITTGTAIISTTASNKTTSIQYNASSPRFCCYSSNQTSIAIFKKISEGGDVTETLAPPIFTLNGSPLNGNVTAKTGDKISASCSTEGASLSITKDDAALSLLPYTIGIEDEGKTIVFKATATKEDKTATTVISVSVAKTPVITDVLTDEITIASFNATGGSSTYKDYTFTSNVTGITYKANMATGNSSIQIRAKNSDSGIVTTGNPKGYTLSSIEIEWNSNTATGRTIMVYGDESAYSNAADLFATTNNGNKIKGTELGSIVGTSNTTCDLSDMTKSFIGLRSKSDAMYISKIKLNWAKATQKEPTMVTLEWNEAYPETGLELYVGESKTVTAVVKDATDPTKVYSDAKINYSSDNDDVVSLAGTTLTGNSADSTQITAILSDGQEDTYVLAENAGPINLTVNVKKTDVELTQYKDAPTEITANKSIPFSEIVEAKLKGNTSLANDVQAAITCRVKEGTDFIAISGNQLTGKKAGNIVLVFSVAETEKYNASNELEVSLTVTKAEPELYYDATELVYYLHGDNNTPVQFPVLHAVPTDLPIKYEIEYTGTQKDIATVDENGEVEPKHIGTATVKASFAGNDVYEPKTAEYSLKVEIEEVEPPIKENSFTIEFTKGSTQDGTVVTETTPIVDVFSKGYDKLVESYPYYIANTEDAYVSTEKGLLFNQTTVDKEGKYGNYINLYLDKAYDVTDVEFNLALYDSNDTPMVYFNSSNQGQEINSDGVQKVSLNESREMIYFMAGGSNVDDGRIYIQDVTVHYTEADENASVLAVPALYDENDNLIPKATESITDSDFILVEHQPGVTIHYEYVAGNNSGNESDKPIQSAPARVAQNETSDMHDNVSTDDRSAIKIYPYGKKSEGYNHWTDGTITVYAEDANGNRSATRTINIGTPTSVEGIEAEGNGEVEYFNLQGVKVQNPEKGIYIRVQDGKAVKIAK